MTFKQKNQIELIKLLYKQIILGLWGEAVAAIGLVAALWGAIPKLWLLSWLAFILFASTFCRYTLVYFYRRSTKGQSHYDVMMFWLSLFMIGIFLSGISWGIAGSLLMPAHDTSRQTFIVFVLIGVTAVANALYSPIRSAYLTFLLPAFLPFTIWLFLQGGIFNILSLLAIVYIFLMLSTSFYTYRLISTALRLRFENIALVRNLSNAKHSLEARTHDLEKTLSLVKATLDSNTDGVLVVNANNQVEDFNQRFLEMWNVSPQILHKELNVVTEHIIKIIENPKEFLEDLEDSYRNVLAESFGELYLKNGKIYEHSSQPQRIGDDLVGRVLSFRDVTKRKSLEAKLFYQANYDALTKLPNRALVSDRINQAIAYARSHQLNIAVLFLDLDRFKIINDTMGHGFGDELLVCVANRLIKTVRDIDTVSREGGDEFLIILNYPISESQMIEIANACLTETSKPYIINNTQFNTSISIGVSIYPKDGQDAETLIRNADIAMYRAKEIGRNNVQFFTEELNRKVLSRLRLENNLREALARQEFYLVYQPIASLITGKMIGLEALLRWFHPALGLVPPAEFIPIAEESGIILAIGDWVFNTACQQLKRWEENGIFVERISINLSGRQFKQANFFERITETLKSAQLSPERLTLELTESVIMDEVEKNIIVLQKLKNLGVQIVIDDFGVSYSSLNYLKRLPIDKLKIDRSFIQDIPNHGDDSAITAAIIALAQNLNLKVIAEGVENFKQLEFLRAHHCDEMQGFYYAKPLEIGPCTEFIREGKTVRILADELEKEI